MQVAKKRPTLFDDKPVYQADNLDWDTFMEDGFPWEQGEHVTIVAPTGWGKTTLGLGILPHREYSIVLATKPRDSTLSPLLKEGYKIVEKLPLPPIELYPRIIFWPRIEKAAHMAQQKDEFRKLLMNVYEVGGWSVYVDELDYICNYLKLSPLVELLWRQGRSLGISVIGGTQRPAFIPLLAYDQATHLFIGRDNDDVNISRYASIAGGGKPYKAAVKNAISALREHEFLYVSARREGFVTTKVSA
jgi:energy-coupling factor transporter ATP-binding protein EcfA2